MNTSLGLSFALALFVGCGSSAVSSVPTPASSATPPASCTPRDASNDELVQKNRYGDLHGTLVVPAGCGAAPVVLFVAGSGPTNRDGNTVGHAGPRPLALFADALAQHGIASLRFDKGGIAASRNASPPRENDITFDEYVDDVALLVRALRADARFDRVFIAGHSEGSLLGILAANRTPVNGVVSLAGAGRPSADVLRAQLETKLSGALLADAERIIHELEQGRTTTDVPSALDGLFRPSVQPYLISWMKYSPEAAIHDLKAPALVVQGTTDLQVTVDDAQRLHAANAASELALIDGMNHVLKNAEGDLAAQKASYEDPDLPLANGLVDRVVAFVDGAR